MSEERSKTTMAVLYGVHRERERQHEKWGTQRHSWPEWMTILGEEYGEACEAAVHLRWPPADTTLGLREMRDQLRTELAQLAAVAVAIIEHIDEIQK